MQKSLVETLIGAVVLVVAGLFLYYAYSAGGRSNVEGYELVAKFDRVDGLREGSDVRMSGIKIGTVTQQTLDPQTFLAVVKMNVRSNVKLPTDSSAQIASDGLLGDKYLTLQPGAEDATLKPGGEITHTQGSIDIVSLVGRMIFSQTGQKGAADGKDAGK